MGERATHAERKGHAVVSLQFTAQFQALTRQAM